MSDSIVLAVTILLGAIYLVMTLVSAPSYGYIFLIVIGLSTLSLACLIYLWSRGARISLILPIALVSYSVADVGLRFFAGTRVLDLFM